MKLWAIRSPSQGYKMILNSPSYTDIQTDKFRNKWCFFLLSFSSHPSSSLIFPSSLPLSCFSLSFLKFLSAYTFTCIFMFATFSLSLTFLLFSFFLWLHFFLLFIYFFFIHAFFHFILLRYYAFRLCSRYKQLITADSPVWFQWALSLPVW
jgi:hypothetical protein